MAEILLFHHVQGLTPGVHVFADRLREAGHTVHVPDLFDGRRFDTIDDGIAFVRERGFDTVVSDGRRIAAELPSELVYAGFSLGVMPAQFLAQTRPGAVGALLLHGCVPPSEFGSDWPAGVPVQIHGMDGDPSFAGEGDLDAAQALVAAHPDEAELFVYPGDGHLFADPSLPDYDEEAAALLTTRVLEFLDRVAGPSSSA
jgi:dienelactone hydrolase